MKTSSMRSCAVWWGARGEVDPPTIGEVSDGAMPPAGRTSAEALSMSARGSASVGRGAEGGVEPPMSLSTAPKKVPVPGEASPAKISTVGAINKEEE